MSESWQFELPRRAMRSETGHCYVVELPVGAPEGDSPDSPFRSTLELLEDNAYLGPAHSMHEGIREVGKGHFSHWSGLLFFSTSDNSDPRQNGRIYKCRAYHVNREMASGIYLNCLPKSGSDYISNLLVRGLCLQPVERTGGTFPERYLAQGFFDDLGAGWICRGHEAYNRYHKFQISTNLDRMVVHVRDPRAAVLSLTHYADVLVRENRKVALYHGMNNDFFQQPLTKRIDYMIDYATPVFVAWIQNWLDAQGDSGFKTKIWFTSFEEFRQSTEKYLTALLDFYEISRAQFRWSELNQPIGLRNFRKGEIDEWRQSLNSIQTERINEWVPDVLLQRFGWER